MYSKILIFSRRWVKYFLPGLMVSCMIFFTGCTVPKDMFEPSVELEQGAIGFQLAEKRWPKDYEELSMFLKHSDYRAYTNLQAVKFHRLDFISLPGGKLKIDADYTTASGDASINGFFVLSTPKTSS